MESAEIEKIRRLLDEAEGYLMLNLPARALALIERRDDWGTLEFEARFLSGEALRQLGHYREAIKPLEQAERLQPGHVAVAISLGWCYKRANRLAQAVDALERAARAHPDEPLPHYNLACYWSLAGNPSRALVELDNALALDPELLARVACESDFDPIRSHPDFKRLTAARATPST